MGFTFACRDLGVDCDVVVEGDTVEDVLAKGAVHAKEVHGYTDEQLNDPEMVKRTQAAVKQK